MGPCLKYIFKNTVQKKFQFQAIWVALWVMQPSVQHNTQETKRDTQRENHPGINTVRVILGLFFSELDRELHKHMLVV